MKLHLSYLTPVMALALVVPDGTPTDPPKSVNVKTAAKRIDRLLELDMKRAKIAPNAMANDATFLRRTYAGIIGRIPTAKETLEFLNSQDQNKRSKLVDSLLNSPGFNSHMFNFWADLLRVKSRLNNQVSGEPFIHYLKDSIGKNKPYDVFVKEMVTASGAAHSRNNGATGLLMRDRGMPLDSMANTVRVFLGTRLECAQCHDHPFDKWKQKDFYQMAAFAGGLSYRNDLAKVPGANNVRKMYGELRQKKDRDGQRALGRMLRQVNTGLNGSGTGLINLPKDYKYDDAKPRSLVKAHAIFGKTPRIEYKQPKPKKTKAPKRDARKWRRMSAKERMKERARMQAERGRGRGRSRAPELNTRVSYGEWLTSATNPRFTKVIANRMWKSVMGRGLIEPVDNIMEKTESSNPALMKYLEKLMVDVDYDLKQFQRVLFNTNAFQREATKKEIPSDQKYHFQGPVLRRMTAEQVWDSMLTLVVADVDTKLREPDARAQSVYNGYERLINMSEEELRAEVNQQKLRYSDPKKYRAQQRQRQQQLQVERRRKAQGEQRKQSELRKRAQPLYRALIKARRASDVAKIAQLKGELKKMGIDVDAVEKKQRDRGSMMRRSRGRGRGRTQLVRASDQQHPAPNGHFLRKFGQSDRDQIQASHTEANVPQVLSLLNGFIEKQVLSNSGSALMRSIDSVSSSKEKVRRAYLGILNREPRGREQAVWAHEIDTEGSGVIKDLVWILVNTHEFRFIQ